MPAMLKTTTCASLACLLLISCAQTPVQVVSPGSAAHAETAAVTETAADLAQLEEIFWTCDYVATTRGIDATPIPQCTAATRELCRVKFDGSFQRMLAWWREKKHAVHGRLRAERNDPL